ncbi:MAG: hypothetical protein L0387_28370 [Acidobacteria bacterium]|nr:hypothetical protein [Acidobacteriota bacterium]MCI0625515.1 hypothetical protein [Acidobacteriota bacterium]MCI0721066.1 hypothetical protein [Acidobacteriota bacterium]
MGTLDTLHHLAMTKPQKALLIFLAFAFASIVWVSAQERNEEEFEGFEDGLLALAQVSEQITVNQLSLKSFRCQEKISILETDSKTKSTQRQEFSHPYSVTRKPDRRVNEKLIFAELRAAGPEGSTGGGWDRFPLVDQPFTGRWTEAFSFENRLANDFKKQPAEQIDGKSCLVFAFETVPEITSIKISLLGQSVPLRQRGRVWIDAKKHQLVRLAARQTKLPKGCRSYEYRIDFQPQRLFGRSMSLPARAELKVQLKEKTLVVLQHYSQFEEI